MAYATASQLENRLGTRLYLVFADRDGDGVADSSAVTEALDAASSLVDSYLTKWLPIPSPVPDVVVRATCDIAAFDLAGSDRENELVFRRYKEAVLWCKDVAKGDAAPFPAEPTADLAAAGGPQFVAGDRQFSRSTMRGVV